ncbi:putative splicing factor, arginine/serine-rich 6 isoform X2 [Convolutriloba macropyga]|uniref:putative splicing factor, arginine/serine-rich 6 isoform X1 n=1 Tax=Convolutriloba macropyga TaxID=536237 RepID=UPI003F51EF69
MKETKVYVGDLDDFATEKELRDAFEQFGNVTHVWVSKKPPGFAFVSMTNYEDAEDAVRGLDGSELCGVRARVEISKKQSYESRGSKNRSSDGDRGGDYQRRDTGDHYTDRPYASSKGLADRYRDRSPNRSRRY